MHVRKKSKGRRDGYGGNKTFKLWDDYYDCTEQCMLHMGGANCPLLLLLLLIYCLQ